jgi:hypothetical protein
MHVKYFFAIAICEAVNEPFGQISTSLRRRPFEIIQDLMPRISCLGEQRPSDHAKSECYAFVPVSAWQ